MAQGSLSGSKGRIYLLLGGVVGVIAIGVFIIVANPFGGSGDNLNNSGSSFSGVGSGGGTSTGGASDQTVIDAVNKQNEENAQNALKTGGSSVATTTGEGAVSLLSLSVAVPLRRISRYSLVM